MTALVATSCSAHFFSQPTTRFPWHLHPLLYSYSVSLLMFCFYAVNEISVPLSLSQREREKERASNISVVCLKCTVRYWRRQSQKLLPFARKKGREREKMPSFFSSFLFEEISTRMNKCSRLAYHEQRCTENDVFYPYFLVDQV